MTAGGLTRWDPDGSDDEDGAREIPPVLTAMSVAPFAPAAPAPITYRARRTRRDRRPRCPAAPSVRGIIPRARWMRLRSVDVSRAPDAAGTADASAAGTEGGTGGIGVTCAAGAAGVILSTGSPDSARSQDAVGRRSVGRLCPSR